MFEVPNPHVVDRPHLFDELEQLRSVNSTGEIGIRVRLPDRKQGQDSLVHKSVNGDSFVPCGEIFEIGDGFGRLVIDSPIPASEHQYENVSVALNTFSTVLNGVRIRLDRK